MTEKKCSQCRYCRVRVAVQMSALLLVGAIAAIFALGGGGV